MVKTCQFLGIWCFKFSSSPDSPNRLVANVPLLIWVFFVKIFQVNGILCSSVSVIKFSKESDISAVGCITCWAAHSSHSECKPSVASQYLKVKGRRRVSFLFRNPTWSSDYRLCRDAHATKAFSTCYQATQVPYRNSNHGNKWRHGPGPGYNGLPAASHHHSTSLGGCWRLQQLPSPTQVLTSGRRR